MRWALGFKALARGIRSIRFWFLGGWLLFFVIIFFVVTEQPEQCAVADAVADVSALAFGHIFLARCQCVFQLLERNDE